LEIGSEDEEPRRRVPTRTKSKPPWKFAHGNLLVVDPLERTLEKTIQARVFFEMWNDNEKPKQKSETKELGKDRWYNQMGQVVTGWTWDKWDRDRVVSILSGTGWNWDRGVFRLGGTGWDSGQVSVQLNQSTCPKVGLHDRAFLRGVSSAQGWRNRTPNATNRVFERSLVC